MEKALTVAKALYNMYKDMFDDHMDEMKMHDSSILNQHLFLQLLRMYRLNQEIY